MHHIILCDLDGTLSLCGHRRHYVQREGKKDWTAFHWASQYDPPNWSMIETLGHLAASTQLDIWIVSGRSDEVKVQTVDWLERYDVPYDHLIMRPKNDYTPDDELKERWMHEYGWTRYNVLCVFDDRDRVVEMWRRNGLFVCQVAPGDF